MVLIGCNSQYKQGGSNNTYSTGKALTETVAISKAKEKLGISKFPDNSSKVDGVIEGGGPSPGIEFPGEFETKIEKNGDNSYIVTFTESWNAKEFHYSGQTGPMRSHFFKYEVTSNNVRSIGDGGDFPPQFVK